MVSAMPRSATKAARMGATALMGVLFDAREYDAAAEARERVASIEAGALPSVHPFVGAVLALDEGGDLVCQLVGEVQGRPAQVQAEDGTDCTDQALR